MDMKAIPCISTEESKSFFDAQEVVFLDVRDPGILKKKRL